MDTSPSVKSFQFLLKSYLILLGNSENNSLIEELDVKIRDYNLGNDGYLIKAFKNPFDKQ